MFHLYLPVLSQNEVFLLVSHEYLNISTSFLFPSVVFFWLLILALQLQMCLSIFHNRCKSYVSASFPWHLKNTFLTEQLLLELVTCSALKVCLL